MLVLRSPSHLPSFIPLIRDELTIGRHAPQVDVYIDHKKGEEKNVISRTHAKILRQRRQSSSSASQYEWVVLSIGTNGLSINGVKKQQAVLCEGDEIVFAPSSKYESELVYRFYTSHDTAFPKLPGTTDNQQHRGHQSEQQSEEQQREQMYSAIPTANGITLASSISPHATAFPSAFPQVSADERRYSRYSLFDESPNVTAYIPMPQHAMTRESPAVRRAAAAYTADVSMYSALPNDNDSPSPFAQHPPATASATSASSWNERFHESLSLPESTEAEILSKYQILSALSTDFVSLAKTYGRIIISEYFLPNEQQSIKPEAQIGGFAGGKKYVVRGILFKLCADVQLSNGSYLYGGETENYEHSNKVGGHELKSAIRVFPFHSLGLCGPMMALVDYAGFRLIAMSLLPLSPHSVPVYGSSDGGKTISAEHQQFNHMMQRVANELHLSEHTVGGKQLFSAGDVEGHVGRNAANNPRGITQFQTMT